MNKVVDTLAEALSEVESGQTMMIGSFLNCGSPDVLIDGLLEKGIKDLTVIANDSAVPEKGIGKLIVAKAIKKAYFSHIGTNPETGRQLNAKETEVHLVPQGTLIEQIRCAGAGIGGFLTPTGVGTAVEEGKQKMTIDGKDYLLELAMGADVALIKAWKADKSGNLVFRRTARNFNPLIAMAAKHVIVEAENIVEVGEIDPDHVITPGILVDKIFHSPVGGVK